ncbi:MAG: FtsX-like permease family protein [Bryobacteraceae bacterium]
MLSYSVSQRTSELGIRLALGARPRAILALVLKQAGALVGAGVALGLAAAFALTRYLQSLLFGVQRTDWTAYAVAVALLAAVSMLAALLPARRGSKLDPMAALREE